jgi:putative ABC transport system permease protein
VEKSWLHFVGLTGSYDMGRPMRGMGYDIGSMDPVAFSVVAGVLMLFALLACYVPAPRATQVDPMAALRQD